MRLPIITTLLIMICFSNCSSSKKATTQNIDLLNNSKWEQAYLDKSGEIKLAPPNRAGHYLFNFSGNGKLEFVGPPNCGFGSKKIGVWEVKKNDLSITFSELRVGKKMPDKIDESHLYTIEILSKDVLVFTHSDKVNFTSTDKVYLVKQ